MKVVCIYHSIDLDGWMSAAIVKHWWENSPDAIDNNDGELDFIGYNYGEHVPDLSEYDRVIMCDVSFPKEVMLELFNRLKDNLIVIDHHSSFINGNQPYTNNKIRNYLKQVEDKKEQFIKYFKHDEWLPVVGHENSYEVSNNGNVRSLNRKIKASDGKEYNRKSKLLKPYFSKRGYYVVNLPSGQKGVHKIVAESFIDNPYNFNCVNHIDGNTKNNTVSNLEWCNYSKNNKHALDNNMRIPNNKAVVQLTLDGNFLKWYYSLAEAERETNVSWTNISSVCRNNGISKTAGGYKWVFVEDYNKNKFEGLRDTKYAACELTWYFLFPNEIMPEIVRLLGRYDCFGHKETEEEQKVLEFQYGARMIIDNYEKAYDNLKAGIEYSTCNENDSSTSPEEDILIEGKPIYKYLCAEARQIYKRAFSIILKERISGFPDAIEVINRKFLCVNQSNFNPGSFNQPYTEDGYDGFMTFEYVGGDRWKFSLRSETIDVSAIAKQFGGGGHAGASGFVLDTRDFINFLNLKE